MVTQSRCAVWKVLTEEEGGDKETAGSTQAQQDKCDSFHTVTQRLALYSAEVN